MVDSAGHAFCAALMCHSQNMAQGSAIHEAIELEVVQKIEVQPETAEDEQVGGTGGWGQG